MSLDDRLREGLPRLAAGAEPDPEERLRRVVSGGRRRQGLYRAGAAVAVAAVVAGAAVATPRVLDALRPEARTITPSDRPGETAPVPRPTGQGTVVPAPEGTDSGFGIPGPLVCYEEGFTDTELPFRPAYLPEGFEEEAHPGPAPGAPPAEDGQVVVHWTDGQGRAFEARNPGTLFAELAQEDDAPTVTVLGEETADFGPIVPMEEDYIVQFMIERKGEAVPRHPCSLWSLNEHGLPLEELLRVAKGLQRT
jgi:hypothetical protein